MNDSQLPHPQQPDNATAPPVNDQRLAYGSPWPIVGALVVLALLLGIFVQPRVVEPSSMPSLSFVLSTSPLYMESLIDALDCYRTDEGAYPPHAVGRLGVNGWAPPDSPVAHIPTLPIGPNGGCILTTPVNYIPNFDPTSGLPKDPQAPVQGAAPGYFAWRDAYVLFSPGPDGRYDLTDPSILVDKKAGTWNEERINALTYDPTNGASSSGDILVFSP